MQSIFTGVSPMHGIGKMERFQPPELPPKGPQMAHRHSTRPPFGFPSCPSCGIHDRTLGPADGNPGRWAAAAPVEMAQRLTKCKWQKSRTTAAFRGITLLLDAAILVLLCIAACNRRKPIGLRLLPLRTFT